MQIEWMQKLQVSFLMGVFIVGLLGCGSGGGSGDGAGAQNLSKISFHAPTTDVPALIADTPTVLTTTVFVPVSEAKSKASAPAQPQPIIGLERLDSNDVVTATLGNFHDDGLNGDVNGGDGVFSIQVTLTEQGPDPIRFRVSAIIDPLSPPTVSDVITIPVYQIPSINSSSDYNRVVDDLFTNLVNLRDAFVSLNNSLSDSNSAELDLETFTSLLQKIIDSSTSSYKNVLVLKMVEASQSSPSLKAGIRKLSFAPGFRSAICAIPFLGGGCTILDVGDNGQEAMNLVKIVRANGADPRVPIGVRNCLLQQMSEAELSDPELEDLRGALYLQCPKGSGGFLDTLGEMAETGVKFEIGQAFSPATDAIGNLLTTAAEVGKIVVQTGVNFISDKVIDWYVDNSGQERIRVSEISDSQLIDIPVGTHNLIILYGGDAAPSIVEGVTVSTDGTILVSAPPGTRAIHGSGPVTIVLRGVVLLDSPSGGQGNPAFSGQVTVVELNKSDTLNVTDSGVYSIQGVPVGASYTVTLIDPNDPTVNLTCGITIPDTITLYVTVNTGGSCIFGGVGNPGELILNFTLLLDTPPSPPSLRFSVIDLGDLPGGGDSSRASALNNLGMVVGSSTGVADSDYSGFGTGSADKPFLWTSASGMQVLPAGGFSPASGIALGINNDNTVVGCLDFGFAGGRQPFIWTATNGMQHLGSGCATAINDAGVVVGYSGGNSGGSAFRWPVSEGQVGLGIAGQNTYAWTINNLGTVGGSAGIEACNTRPVIWDANGRLQSIDPPLLRLPDTFYCHGRITGINDNGVAVGDVFLETEPRSRPERGMYSFVWSPSTGSRSLGELQVAGGHPDNHALATGINNSGQVVGSSHGHAFIWTSESGMRDLNDLLDESGTGWELTDASAINNSGQIVGGGIHNGVLRAFLLTPLVVPSP